MKKIMLAVLFVLLLPITASALDLSGTWTSDTGATYYLRQIGSEVFWYGENDPTTPSWSNVAHGKYHSSRLILSWGDVPKGTVTQSGVLVLKVLNAGTTLQAISKTGGFVDSTWTKNP